MEDLQSTVVLLLNSQTEQYEYEEKLQKMMELLKRTQDTKPAGFFFLDAVDSIEVFSYNPEEGITFAAYFRRYEDVFRKECKEWIEQKKVCLLLQKLYPVSHDRYCKYILTRKLGEVSFNEAVEILMKIFWSSLFNIYWKCLNLTKKLDEDFFTYAGVVNRECEKFKLEELSPDQFKCLIFGSSRNSDSYKIGTGSKASITGYNR